MNKICFIYFEKPYVVYHSIGIAIELSFNLDNEVHIYCSSRSISTVIDIVNYYQAKNLLIKQLRPLWYIRIPHQIELTGNILRRTLTKKYQKDLSQFDIIVSTIYTDLYIKEILKSNRTLFAFTNHGIPNRAYSFDNKISAYDIAFLLGDYEYKKRIQLQHDKLCTLVKTGFLKNDVITLHKQTNIFNNDKLTILYNPHWDTEFTSYDYHGTQILKHFAHSSKYNLVFAPHTLLKEKRAFINRKLNKFRNIENILIDLDSRYSYNMYYTKLSDIYMGDISSQAAEFVYIKERPCIFIDAHNIQRDIPNIPLTWSLGQVHSTLNDIDEIIESSISRFKEYYIHKQLEYKEIMFHKEERTASRIAADTIQKALDKVSI